MLAEERARAIVELVRRDGFQAIDALALQFSVTPQTIRRDVNLLCDRGLLRRRHGGVELPPEGENLAYPARQVLNIDAGAIEHTSPAPAAPRAATHDATLAQQVNDALCDEEMLDSEIAG